MEFYISLVLTLGLLVFLFYKGRSIGISHQMHLYGLFLGILLGILCIGLEFLGISFGVIGGGDALMSLLFCLFVVGLFDQLLIFVFIRYSIFPKLTNSLTIFYYAIFLSVVSSIVELFLFEKSDYMLPILNLAGHFSLGTISGYFFAMARQSRDEQQTFTYLNSGLGAAIIVQGLQEFFICEKNYPNLIALILGSALIAYIISAYLFKLRQNLDAETIRQKCLEELYGDMEDI